jgi:hypothetical protein
MSLARFVMLTVAAGVFGFSSYGATAGASYNVAESVPCMAAVCDGNINLTGTITTDALGALSLSDLVSWNLDFSADGQTLGTFTSSNSSFGTVGNPQIVATGDLLVVTINTTADEFNLSGNGSAPGIWTYSGGGPSQLSAESLIWTSPEVQVNGRQSLTLPSNFEATSGLGATPIPEPASFLTLLVSALLLSMVSWLTKLKRT